MAHLILHPQKTRRHHSLIVTENTRCRTTVCYDCRHPTLHVTTRRHTWRTLCSLQKLMHKKKRFQGRAEGKDTNGKCWPKELCFLLLF